MSVGEALPSYRVNGNGTHKRQRIPEPEQLRSFELLRGIRGLDERDARDLAQLGPAADVARAVELLAVACPKPRNCGGWLRRAITDGWAASQQGLA